jgi:hypothetical protein
MPTATNDAKDAGSQTNTATIAGAVVGAVVGVGLLSGALFAAYRMGRRRANHIDLETPRKSFRDTLSSLPRPTVSWKRPDPPALTPVCQPILLGDKTIEEENRFSELPENTVSELPVSVEAQKVGF